mmetsp:Transcript_49931/g.150172  ORF Transcript_49931/g.150172 Transcript_49931/m.150172 type:complete len:86 (+) Transcript_49931:179-436(+)
METEHTIEDSSEKEIFVANAIKLAVGGQHQEYRALKLEKDKPEYTYCEHTRKYEQYKRVKCKHHHTDKKLKLKAQLIFLVPGDSN